MPTLLRAPNGVIQSVQRPVCMEDLVKEDMLIKAGLTPDHTRWLRQFEATIKLHMTNNTPNKWVKILNSLIMIGVALPTEAEDTDLTPEAQKYYNKQVHDLLVKHKIIPQLRETLARDMKTIDPYNPECGRIAERKYGKKIYQYFLKQRPTIGLYI